MNQIPQMKRVDSVDALRGFAVVAIMLLHFVEHFIYGVYPEATSKTAELLNQSVWDALFFIFAGKSYTVFALLFGFTFIVQQRNQEAKGGDFGGRFAWRLVILMFFATLNAAFFPGGDVLLLFAIMGFVMIPLRKLSQRNLLLIASLFLIQPIELLECFGIDFIPTLLNDTYYPTLKTVIDSGNFWDMIVANAGIGQLASLFWAVDTGRLLQAPGLFILGMILARGDYFSRGAGFWVKTFVGSFIASFLFLCCKDFCCGCFADHPDDVVQYGLYRYARFYVRDIVSERRVWQNDRRTAFLWADESHELHQSVNHRKSDILSLRLRAGINVGHCMELRSGSGGNVCSNMVLPPVAQDA